MAENPLLTPEDKVALAELSGRLRKGRIAMQVRDSSRLRPWMRVFAYWDAFTPKTTLAESLLKASFLAKDQVSKQQLRLLRSRPDYLELRQRYEDGGANAALEMLKADLPFYMESHRKGLEMAMAAEDYNAIPKFTIHPMEIVHPRRHDLMAQQVTVNVMLSSKQEKLMLSERPVIEAEVVEPSSDE